MYTLLATVVILYQDGRFRRASLSCRGAPPPRTQPAQPWTSWFPDPILYGSGNIMLQCGNHAPLAPYLCRPAAGWNGQLPPYHPQSHTAGMDIAEPAPTTFYYGR